MQIGPINVMRVFVTLLIFIGFLFQNRHRLIRHFVFLSLSIRLFSYSALCVYVSSPNLSQKHFSVLRTLILIMLITKLTTWIQLQMHTPSSVQRYDFIALNASVQSIKSINLVIPFMKFRNGNALNVTPRKIVVLNQFISCHRSEQLWSEWFRFFHVALYSRAVRIGRKKLHHNVCWCRFYFSYCFVLCGSTQK